MTVKCDTINNTAKCEQSLIECPIIDNDTTNNLLYMSMELTDIATSPRGSPEIVMTLLAMEVL